MRFINTLTCFVLTCVFLSAF
ncbi:hypothetical protein LCGC14_2840210, partial [marine sediment metagenome]